MQAPQIEQTQPTVAKATGNIDVSCVSATTHGATQRLVYGTGVCVTLPVKNQYPIPVVLSMEY